MKIHQPKHPKAVVILKITIVLILSGLTATAHQLKLWPFTQANDNSINLEKATDEEKKTGTQIKEQSLNGAANSNKNQSGSDQSLPPQPIEGSNKKSVNIEITSAIQDQSALRIRSLIQTVTNTGECTITLSQPGRASYTATADIQALSSSATCKGFDIPLDQLSKGTWKITLSFANDELTAQTEKDISIQ
jgi:hypothetical protein